MHILQRFSKSFAFLCLKNLFYFAQRYFYLQGMVALISSEKMGTSPGLYITIQDSLFFRSTLFKYFHDMLSSMDFLLLVG